MARIHAIGTSTPPHHVPQAVIREAARRHFLGGLPEADRLVAVFDNVQVDTRYFCVPMDWFQSAHTFEERNETYLHWAEKLAAEAIEDCLGQAGVGPEEIDHLIFVSTSGLATPSVDARLINRLGFRGNVKRTPVFGLGCAGGAAGLSRCRDLSNGQVPQRILMVSVEISSLTFQTDDFRKSNLVATSLFSDGAAAVLISNSKGAGPEIVDTLSTLWPDSLDVMGWEFSHTGLRVIFSRHIPYLIGTRIKSNIEELLRHNQLSIPQIRYFALHPGGARILESFEETLGLDCGSLQHSRSVLREFGNMSSPTVLFVLRRLLENGRPDPGEFGLCAAFGPGFSSELLLLRF